MLLDTLYSRDADHVALMLILMTMAINMATVTLLHLPALHGTGKTHRKEALDRCAGSCMFWSNGA